MKFSRLMVIVACFCLFSYMSSGTVFGFGPYDLAVSISDETPTQGSVVVITVEFTNQGSEELEIYRFGLNFDWMEPTRFAGSDLSANPVTIQAGAIHTFSPVTVEIPSNASLGTHSYFVGIDGLEGQTEVTWDSTPEVIVVQDFWQDTYNDLLEQTSNNMSIAENKTYNSPEAQSYLQQAQSAYSNALDYASHQNWEDAISALQSTSMYLEQTETEEQNYVAPEPEQDLTLIILGASVAAVVIIVIAVLFLRRKPKT